MLIDYLGFVSDKFTNKTVFYQVIGYHVMLHVVSTYNFSLLPRTTVY